MRKKLKSFIVALRRRAKICSRNVKTTSDERKPYWQHEADLLNEIIGHLKKIVR